VSPTAPYRFFDFAEARFTEAACERLIPANSRGPGAGGAGIAHYIDRHLSSPWGSGTIAFREADWQPGTTQYIPRPFTPATLFRRAFAAIDLILNAHAGPFERLSPQSQDQFLRHLESGRIDLRGAPADVFFDMLLRMTVEGFFSDPRYGTTRDRIGWRLRGFPGAHAVKSASTTSPN
jgi:gluconate 2-dehydrogenase gamma chain